MNQAFYTGVLSWILASVLAACTPKYDWREVRGTNAPFVVTLPAKPVTLSRPINLAGLPLTMTMTAAEVDGVTFAVGSAPLRDPAKAQVALNAMKSALVKNIGGTIRQEKAAAIPGVPTFAIEIEATGVPSANSGGRPRLLLARFMSGDQHIYQAVVVGPDKAVSRDAVDLFFTSFKLN
jgi:hypothetical protein